jgi:hypothetical protein
MQGNNNSSNGTANGATDMMLIALESNKAFKNIRMSNSGVLYHYCKDEYCFFDGVSISEPITVGNGEG